MKTIRLSVGIISLILSVVVAAEFLLEILWNLLSMEDPGLGIIQMITVFITLVTIGVIAVIYHDINTCGFRLMQFALYLLGTGLLISIIHTEDMICNIVKIWLSMATIEMFFALIFIRTDKPRPSKL